MTRQKKQIGFTLVELMVVLMLVVVIMGALYQMYAQSVSAYRVQGELILMQQRLRFGLEHIKRDLKRAGFLATPNSQNDPNVCPKPVHMIRAVTIQRATGSVYHPFPGSNPYVEPSAIILFGDFFSGRTYKIQGITGNQVVLQPDANYPSSLPEFNRIFDTQNNRYLRIVTQDQFEIYLPIIDAQYDNRTITLGQAVPAYSPTNICGVVGFGTGLEASVGGFIRYRIAADSRPGAALGKTDLIREELQIDGQTVVPGTQLVIADYAVDLQFYDFGFDTDDTGSDPNIVVYSLVEDVVNTAGGGLLGSLPGAEPEDLRFLTVKLTLRTEDEDPDYTYQPRLNYYEPLRGYEITQMTGACRTLTMATRVGLTSLAVRNLKP